MSAKPPKYYSEKRYEMLPFVPQDVKRVLEIWYGEGEFTWTVKKERNAEG